MYIKKKNGFIMLEILLFINILCIIILCDYKIIIANNNKLLLYEIKEDIKTLGEDENQLLNEVINEMKKDKGVNDKFKNYNDDLEIEYYYNFSKNNKLILVIEKGNILIKDEYEKNKQSIRVLAVKYINKDTDKEEIFFLPTTYKRYEKIE